ncbi:hypothetical protein ACHAPQ_006205 [Fusarium lateritium]
MAFLNLIALALVASAGVKAGPCHPSSSTTLAAISIETTSTVSSNAVSTATASSLEASTTTSMTTAEVEPIVSTTTTTVAATTAPAPVTQCSDLEQTYYTVNNTPFMIYCNYRFTSYSDSSVKIPDLTFEACVKACSEQTACQYALLEAVNGNMCVLVQQGFGFTANTIGYSLAERLY